jgi:hypothetical protein
VITIVNVIIYKKNKANPMASSPKHVVYENRDLTLSYQSIFTVFYNFH